MQIHCDYGFASCLCYFFFFNDTATTEIYTLSLHDALPIWGTDLRQVPVDGLDLRRQVSLYGVAGRQRSAVRSEEHTSELQSLAYLVCRLLLEKKKKNNQYTLMRKTNLAVISHVQKR